MNNEEWVKVYIAAGVAIKKDNKFLMVQEKQKSAYGLWNLPAGKVNLGETIEQAAIRETKEETGYDVKIVRPLDIFQADPTEAAQHSFEAEIIGGEINFPENEILDVKWFTFEEILELNSQGKLRRPWVLGSFKMIRS